MGAQTEVRVSSWGVRSTKVLADRIANNGLGLQGGVLVKNRASHIAKNEGVSLEKILNGTLTILKQHPLRPLEQAGIKNPALEWLLEQTGAKV